MDSMGKLGIDDKAVLDNLDSEMNCLTQKLGFLKMAEGIGRISVAEYARGEGVTGSVLFVLCFGDDEMKELRRLIFASQDIFDVAKTFDDSGADNESRNILRQKI